MHKAGCPERVKEAAESKGTATCVHCKQEKIFKDTVCCWSYGDMTALSLRRRRGLWPTEPAGGGSWGQGDSEGTETQGWQCGSQTAG